MTERQPKNKQVQFRLTQADRDVLERLSTALGISMSDVMSKAINQLSGEPGLVVHDYLDGKGAGYRCRECKGPCRLKADDRAVSQLVRQIMLLIAMYMRQVGSTSIKLPKDFEAPLRVLLGAQRYQSMWARALRN